jgi:hypothetical protein
MKKISILLVLTLFWACSNSDNSNSSSNSDFHPPDWIQGVWKQNTMNSYGGIFSFSKNDFCVTLMGTAKQCQQESINQSRKFGNAVVVTEAITTTTYTAEMKYSNGQSVIYSFRKLSNNSIEWTSVSNSVFIKQ